MPYTARDYGLVSRVVSDSEALEAARGIASYERVNPSGHHHHHAICRRCGRMEPFEDRGFVLDRASAVASDLTQRMRHMPPAEFQDLLRPCFQEDEVKLILLGGALGLLARWLQLQWM